MAIKSSRGVTSGKGTPQRLEGQNGDISVRRSSKGKHLFVKDMNKWHSVTLDVNSSQMRSHINSLLKEVKRLKTKQNNRPLVDVVHFRVPGSNNVQLKNVGAILKVRNAADSADADIQCANIRDSNGNKTIEIKAEASAVNRFTISSSATGNNTVFSLDGDDANIPMELRTKGTGNMRLACAANGSVAQILEDTTIRFQFDPTVATNQPELSLLASANAKGILDTDANAALRLWNKDINSSKTNSHLQISAADTLYLAGADRIYLYSGGTGQDGGTFDMGSWFGTFQAGGSSVLNHTATATSIGYTVDSNLSGDDTQLSKGLHIDYDRTVASSGTATMLDVGIDVDVNSASLGTGLFYGISIDVVGNTSGTSTSTGIYIDSDGSDTNIGAHIITSGTHLKLAADADPTNDYGTIAVADTGDMTIATFGDGTTDSDLILDIDGSIALDSANGNFIAKNAGTEFSVANSAYAGMIVGYTCIRNTDAIAGDDVITIGTTMTVLQTVNGTDVSVTFKAPPSGNVEIMFSAMVYGVSKEVLFALSDNATFNEVNQIHTYDAFSHKMDETDQNQVHIPFVLTGLTAGDSYTYFVGADSSGVSAYIYHGSTRTNLHSPPITMKATALPGTITTGT